MGKPRSSELWRECERRQSEGWAEWENSEGALKEGEEYMRECEGRSEKRGGRCWGTRGSMSEKSGGSLRMGEESRSFWEEGRMRFMPS